MHGVRSDAGEWAMSNKEENLMDKNGNNKIKKVYKNGRKLFHYLVDIVVEMF